MKVSQLTEHPRNHEFFQGMIEDEWATFLEDIKVAGITSPLTINKGGFVVKGNLRLKACRELNIKTVPCLIVEYENDEQELMDLWRDNIIRREPNIFTKMKLVQELKKRYPGRQGQQPKALLNNLTKLKPTDIMRKFLSETPQFMAMANLFNALPIDKQTELKEWFYSQERGPSKKELDEKIRKLTNELNNSKEEIEILEPYRKGAKKIEEIQNKIDELVKKQSKLFKDAEGVKYITTAVVKGREYFTKQCMVIAALKVTEDSKKLMRDDILALTELVENWLNAIKQRFL
jgi:hypothetical protein